MQVFRYVNRKIQVRKMKQILFCLIIITLFAVSIFGQDSSEKVQTAAEQFVSDYNAKNYAAIEARFN